MWWKVTLLVVGVLFLLLFMCSMFAALVAASRADDRSEMERRNKNNG